MKDRTRNARRVAPPEPEKPRFVYGRSGLDELFKMCATVEAIKKAQTAYLERWDDLGESVRRDEARMALRTFKIKNTLPPPSEPTPEVLLEIAELTRRVRNVLDMHVMSVLDPERADPNPWPFLPRLTFPPSSLTKEIDR